MGDRAVFLVMNLKGHESGPKGNRDMHVPAGGRCRPY